MEDGKSSQISKYINVEDTGKVQNFYFCSLRASYMNVKK